MTLKRGNVCGRRKLAMNDGANAGLRSRRTRNRANVSHDGTQLVDFQSYLVAELIS